MPASLFADLPWHVLVAVPLIVLAGYTVFGATGFGSSIIIVPALAHWFALTAIVPPMLLGIAAGALLLFNLPRAPALLALGVFVAAYGAYLLGLLRERG